MQGPRLLEQLREASTINFQCVSSNSEVVGPSYDQNNEHVNEHKSDEHFKVSVNTVLVRFQLYGGVPRKVFDP